MAIDRSVRWSKDALDFFESALDNSLVLDIVISHACRSQTGEGFEEFVNSVNSDAIRRKVKKINIIDTSYLYRHGIPEFSSYADPSIATEWFLINQNSINRLLIDDVNLKSWADGLNTDSFKSWNKKIIRDFSGDENGNGLVQSFRDIVMQEAGVAVYKGNSSLKSCTNFILEECAYTCANLQNTILVYPTGFLCSIKDCLERYNIKIVNLNYKISKHAQKNERCISLDSTAIEKEVTLFMKEKVKNVNFFVIDKYGKHIYKNYSCERSVGKDVPKLNQKTWRNNTEIMRTKKQITIKEISDDGVSYLSVKAPLIIDDKVEGIIGLAIDITDQERAQQLELENTQQQWKIEEQNKFKTFVQQVSHDIRSPLVTLSMLVNACKNLPEKEHIALRNTITSIENISNNLLDTYEENGELASQKTEYVLLPFSLFGIIKEKECQYQTINVKFNFFTNSSGALIFIRGDFLNYARMISNLLNNAVEATEGRDGLVEVNFVEKDQLIEIHIKDNGKGMPQEMVDKILHDVSIGTTKASGHGLGMQQIKDTLQKMNGKMLIESTENVGTEFTLIFPKSKCPEWFAEKIVLPKGSTVVVLDDDPSIHSVWENRLKDYSNDITVKYFTQGNEAIDFINSSKEKNRIFLLADYELRNQYVNGVDVTEKCNMQNKSILVTSVYMCKIKEFPEKCDVIKVLSKALIPDIPIVIEEERETGKADIVFIDDNKILTQSLSNFFESKELRAHTYNSPDAFLENLLQYSKNTKIVMDNELTFGINGIELANLLHEKGYANLYLLSGRPFREDEVPSYLSVIFKGSEDFIEKLL